MDWHCRAGGKPPEAGSDWYLVCGNPFPNHIEYILTVTMFALVGFYIYMQMLSQSGNTNPVEEKVPHKQKTK